MTDEEEEDDSETVADSARWHQTQTNERAVQFFMRNDHWLALSQAAAMSGTTVSRMIPAILGLTLERAERGNPAAVALMQDATFRARAPGRRGVGRNVDWIDVITKTKTMVERIQAKLGIEENDDDETVGGV